MEGLATSMQMLQTSEWRFTLGGVGDCCMKVQACSLGIGVWLGAE